VPGASDTPQVVIPGGSANNQPIPVAPPRAADTPPPPVRTVLAPLPDEVTDEVVIVKPGRKRDPVAAVFQDVLGLFGSSSDEPATKVRTKKSASELILPLPNTGKSKGSTALERLRKRNNSN
jgi:hypothetical protein